jgi:hypothetical protein
MTHAKSYAADVMTRFLKDRPGPAADRTDSGRAPVKAPTPARQREVQFSDFEGVAGLKEREGLPKDNRENWRRLWQHNPVLAVARPPPCMGWVLETAEGIVGYQGSLPLLYWLGDRTLVGAVGTGLAIDPAYRARAIGLMTSFYRQPRVDLLFVTFAIESVTKLSKILHGKTLPQRDYGKVLFWILDARRFTKALAAKFGLGSGTAAVGTFLGSSVLRADMGLRRGPRGRLADGFEVAEIGVKDIGDEFEDLWRRKLTETPRLLVDRSPASLRWHFTIPGGSSRAAVLCCRRSGRLAGYAIVEHSTDRGTGLRRSMLADVLVEQDDPGVTEALLEAAYANATVSGGDFFEVIGLPGHVRRILMRWNPYVRTYPTDPLVYRTADESLAGVLADENGWYAGPMDGDTTLLP